MYLNYEQMVMLVYCTVFGFFGNFVLEDIILHAVICLFEGSLRHGLTYENDTVSINHSSV